MFKLFPDPDCPDPECFFSDTNPDLDPQSLLRWDLDLDPGKQKISLGKDEDKFMFRTTEFFFPDC
jgi:hypothetical protein